MNEIIKAIREVSNYKPEDCKWSAYGRYDGFAIETDKQTIYLLIENGQSCCENWGYLLSHDNFDEFIGAQLLGLREVSEAEIGVSLPADTSCHGSPATVFVNVETSKGTLQFVAYNDHNGYYGHEVRIVSEQLNMTEHV